jgi:hypothetical protein
MLYKSSAAAAAAYILASSLMSLYGFAVSTSGHIDDSTTTSDPFVPVDLEQSIPVEQYRQRVVVDCTALQPRHHAELPTFKHWVLPDLTIVSNVTNTNEFQVVAHNFSVVIPRYDMLHCFRVYVKNGGL